MLALLTAQASAASLNENQRVARQACSTLLGQVGTGIIPSARSTGPNDLRTSCEAIDLQADPAISLARIAAEEVFALGDSLTVSADQQIGNIQSRINRLRTGHHRAVDINSLNLQLQDRKIPGAMLFADTNVLAQFSDGNATEEVIKDSALGLFASGVVSIGDIDGRGIQRDANISFSSLTFGADYRINRHSVVGTALGVFNDTTDFTGDNGNMDMQGFSVSAFGTWYEQAKGYTDIIAEISQNDFDLKRRINLPGQASEFAHSSTDATRMAVSINVGRTFQHGATEFGPVGRIAITRASIDGFKEASTRANEGAGTALDIKSHSRASFRVSIGGELKHVIGTSKAVLVPTARLALETETETDKGAIAATFVNGSDNISMRFTGARTSRNALLISLGSTAVFKHGQSAFVSLETRAMDDHVSLNRFRLGYRMHF